MDAAWLLRHLEYAGLHVEVNGKNIRVFPTSKLTDTYRKAIKEHKRELMKLLQAKSKPAQFLAKLPQQSIVVTNQEAEKDVATAEECPVCHKPSGGNKTCPRCEADERERQRVFQSDYRQSNL
jgi:hypothetical protein